MPATETDIHDLLVHFRAQCGRPTLVIEKVPFYIGGQKAQPVSRIGKLIESAAVCRGIAIALKYRIEEVRPQVWQKALELGTRKKMTSTAWKNKLKGRAQHLNPNIKVTLATADALLILEYAMRQHYSYKEDHQ